MKLTVTGNTITPEVVLDTDQKAQNFKGISIPYDSFDFYKSIIEFIDLHAELFPVDTEFNFQFHYFNTSSSKAIFGLLSRLKELIASGKQWHIRWIYEEEYDFMHESGQDLEDLLDIRILVNQGSLV